MLKENARHVTRKREIDSSQFRSRICIVSPPFSEQAERIIFIAAETEIERGCIASTNSFSFKVRIEKSFRN